MICPICGELTSSYMGNYRKDRLCKKHATALKNGSIIIIGTDNLDHPIFADSKSKQILNQGKTTIPQTLSKSDTITDTKKVCIVCGEPTKSNYKQCSDCYQETRDYMDGLDKNSTLSELRQYYYNLKDYIFRTKDFDRVKTNCNKLIAIAMIDENSNNDSALIDRVYKDVQSLIENKQVHTEEKPTEAETESNKKSLDKKLYFNYAEDGHVLDSEPEVIIDDILYNSEIFHCCHKPVTDITEKSVECDWFIPIDSTNKGIYIEYNGMDSARYRKTKDENIALYRKHNLPLIIIEKDEPKHDRQTFKAHLIKELQQLAERYYGGMPKWKK